MKLEATSWHSMLPQGALCFPLSLKSGKPIYSADISFLALTYGVHSGAGDLLRCRFRDPGASAAKYRKLGSLKKQKFVLSQFWRPEVSDQGGRRATLPYRLWRRTLPASLLDPGVSCLEAASLRPLSLSSRGLFLSASYKDTAVGFRAHPSPGL